LPQALADGGFTSILDVVNMESDHIAGLRWTNQNNLSVPVPLAHRQKLRIAISMYHYWSLYLNGTVDVTTITMADYDEYRISGYHPMDPLIPEARSNNQNGANGYHPPQNTPLAAAGNARPQATRAEMFDRGNKKDKDHYPEFKEEKNWDSFCRSVEVTADTHHGTSDIIDTTYVPPAGDNDAIALFARKNRFMYSVFEAKIKTDMGISIVRSHETDRNAQTVWRKLVKHQTTSTIGALTRESLLGHLTTFKLDTNTWRGTHVSFLVNFQDKIREYERLTPV
jgi:hypothetical protein